MKLLRYQNFIKESKEDIDSICKKYNIQNYVVNDDGTIDVDGSVNLSYSELTEIPLKFRKVSGYFSCRNNKLTSLSGAPREVGEYFNCHNNQLKSLVGSPREVGGYFNCSNNQLTSLERSPIRIGRGFDCQDNQLTSLEGIPQQFRGGYRYIDCVGNQLRDVKGVKDGWGGNFWINRNPVFEIFKLFPEERWDEVVEYLNEYNVIREGKLVILQALEQVFYEMELEVPEIEEIEGYDIQF
jgi:hypothetical protein